MSDCRHAFRNGGTTTHLIRHICYISGEQSVGRSRIGIYTIPIRGKSGLQWTGRQVTPGHGQRELPMTESATENRPPSSGGKGETVE
jgi:hypothetical protein